MPQSCRYHYFGMVITITIGIASSTAGITITINRSREERYSFRLFFSYPSRVTLWLVDTQKSALINDQFRVILWSSGDAVVLKIVSFATQIRYAMLCCALLCCAFLWFAQMSLRCLLVRRSSLLFCTTLHYT